MSKDELRQKIIEKSAFEVAQKAGMHYQTVYNFRYGKPVSERTLAKLEKYAKKYIK